MTLGLESIHKRTRLIEEMVTNTGLMNQLISFVEKFSQLDNFSKQMSLFAQKDDKTSKIIENKIKCVINMKLMVIFSDQLKKIIHSSDCHDLKRIFCVFFKNISKFLKLESN